MPSHTFSWSYLAGSTLSVGSKIYTNVASDERVLPVPKDTSGNIVEVDLDPARIVALYMLADGAALTITPDVGDPIELVAGLPLIWTVDMASYYDCPITAIVDTLSVANADLVNDATLTLGALQIAVAP